MIEFINKFRVQRRNKLSKASSSDVTWLIQNPLYSDVIIKLKKFIKKYEPLMIDAAYFDYWKDQFTEKDAENKNVRGVDYDLGLRATQEHEYRGEGLHISGSGCGNGIHISGGGDIGIGQQGQQGIMSIGGETGIYDPSCETGIYGCDTGIQGMTGVQGSTGIQCVSGSTGAKGIFSFEERILEKQKKERFKLYDSIDDNYKKRRPKPTPWPPSMPSMIREHDKKKSVERIKKKLLRNKKYGTSHLGAR